MLLLQPLLLSIVLGAAAGAGPPGTGTGTGGIFSCKGPKGQAVTSDREIVGCVGDQLERNRDGSFKRIVPPPRTEDEKAADEEKQRLEEQKRTTLRIQQRKEEALLRLYPDIDALEKARLRELASTALAMKAVEARNQELLQARKRLASEAEFYPKGPLPPRLKSDLDANDAALAAQKQVQQNLQDESKRINANFDNDLALLRTLWARQRGVGK